MVDVFVSYKAEDRRRVAPLVDTLQADGLSVWWDAHIGGGADWRESIQVNLERAKCVIVVWSRRSVGPHGRFVRDEATRAQRNGTYLPVRIDKVEPPLGFGETQAIGLTGWSGDRDERYQALVTAVRAIIAGERPDCHAADEDAEPRFSRRTVIAAGGGAVAAAAVGGLLWLRPGMARANSIAVLPFANLSGDPNQSYFSDGIAEELRAALARIPKLRVMARTSSEKVRNDDIQTAATKLDVDSILTGSVRRSPATIRINAQLVDGSSGLERWSEVYDRPAGDALSVQTEIAQKVAAALRVQLGGGGATKPVVTGSSHNPQAQDLYLKGKTAWQGNPTADRLHQAIDLFDQAIRIDPDFADAYAQKALAMLVYTQTFAANSGEHARDVAVADAMSRKALSLAPGLPTAYVAQAMARSARFDFKGALASYETAFADPANGSDAVAEYARFLAAIGLERDAYQWAQRGIEADPLNPRAHQSKIFVLFCDHHYAQAIDASRALLRWSPGRSSTLTRLGECLMLTGKLDEAAAAYAQANPDYPARIVGEAIIAARRGDRAGSDRGIERLRDLFSDNADYRIAGILAQRGDKDAALAALGRAIRVQDPGVVALPTDPFIDPLRDDPLFKQLAQSPDFPAER